MQLTLAETIQILRKRAGLNQAELGSKAFNTTFDSGRTKIKNIELGKQRVSESDLNRIAECLDVPPEKLQSSTGNKNKTPGLPEDGIRISNKVVDMFPDLREYLEMLEKASRIDDVELIKYLSEKISEIWRGGPQLAADFPNGMSSNTKGRTDRA
jgi:transcriptional regulator with XRE-family HTH domain